MTNEDAIKYLPPLDIEDYGTYAEEAYNMAIEALEKQIPKKPIPPKHNGWNWKCPNCLRVEYMIQRDALDTHCGFCGQAIDWSVD